MTRVNIRLPAAATNPPRLTIGGVDYSLQFFAFTGQDSFVDESGLVTFDGQIEIDQIRGGQPINNWDNPELFTIGTAVTFEVWRNGAYELHPRGSLRIIGSAPDEGNPEEGRPPQQTLEVACLIGARLFAGPTDESELLSLVNPGSTTNAITVVNRLLALAGCGVPTYNQAGTTIRFRDVPQLSGSYLESAGKMLASMGLFAWCDRNESIQIHRATDSDPILVISEAELAEDIRPVIVGQPPADEAVVSGSYREVFDRADNTGEIFTEDRGNKSLIAPTPIVQRAPNSTSIIFSGGGQGVISTFRQSEDIDFDNSRVTDTQTETQMGFLVYRGVYGYTVFNQVPSSTVVTVRQYGQDDNAMLERVTKTASVPVITALSNYVDWLLSNDDTAFYSLNLDQLVDVTETIDYTYDEQQQLIREDREVMEPLGSVLGGLGGLDWSIVNALFTNSQLLSTVSGEQSTTKYEAQSPSDWKIITQSRVPACRDSRFQQGILSDILAATTDDTRKGVLNRAIAPASVKTTTQDSSSGQTKPPGTERMPARISSETQSANATVKFGGVPSGWQPRQENYTVPYLSDKQGSGRYGRKTVTIGDTQANQCYSYGSVWHRVAKARHQSAEMGFPLRAEFFSSYRPYGVVRVLRLDGSIYDFALNGTAWGVDPEQAIVSTNGALLNRLQGATVTAGGQPVSPGTVPSEPIEVTDGTIETPPTQIPQPGARVRVGIKVGTSFTRPVEQLVSRVRIGIKVTTTLGSAMSGGQICYLDMSQAEYLGLTQEQWIGFGENACVGGVSDYLDLSQSEYLGLTQEQYLNLER
ncbi:MAG: hypothetical protein AAF151_12060 [Cyanobacteria bacterium J06656_5]